MSMLLHIADRALNTPLMIEAGKAAIIVDVLAGRIGIDRLQASRFEGTEIGTGSDGRPRQLPYRVTPDGVAVVSIVGTLVARGAWIGASSGLVSYEGVSHQLKQAAADAKVRAVILDLHSPGGEAIGAFETAALVRDLASRKRTVAIVNGMAASAAYAIASGASEIVTTETGVSGSIGVMIVHLDGSGKLTKEGIAATLIYAGERKVDGNPFQPLSDAARADIKARVDTVHDLFVRTVATGRGAKLTAAAARATEARTYVGEAAVRSGLADRVGTFEDVLAELSRAPASTASSSISAPVRTALAVPPAKAGMTGDPVRAEYGASAALRAVFPTFDAYKATLDAAGRAALARKG